MDEILSDDAWHPLAELLAASYELVPEQIALRNANGRVQDPLRVARSRFSVVKTTAKLAVEHGSWEQSGEFVRRRQAPPPARVYSQPAPRSPWLKAMTGELADGEWHSFRDVVAVGAKIVPPVRALANITSDRRYRERHYGHIFNDPGAAEVREQTIRSGQWAVAREALQNMIKRNRFYERKGEMVRFKP